MATNVTVSLGVKQNPGNYEQVSQFVSVSSETAVLDGIATKKEIEDKIDQLYDIVEEKLVEKAKENYAVMTGKARRETRIRPE